MTGGSLEELWLIQPWELQITLLQKSSAAMDILMTVTGGVWALSCLNVK